MIVSSTRPSRSRCRGGTRHHVLLHPSRLHRDDPVRVMPVVEDGDVHPVAITRNVTNDGASKLDELLDRMG